jgi:hypothetical protein
MHATGHFGACFADNFYAPQQFSMGTLKLTDILRYGYTRQRCSKQSNYDFLSHDGHPSSSEGSLDHNGSARDSGIQGKKKRLPAACGQALTV